MKAKPTTLLIIAVFITFTPLGRASSAVDNQPIDTSAIVSFVEEHYETLKTELKSWHGDTLDQVIKMLRVHDMERMDTVSRMRQMVYTYPDSNDFAVHVAMLNTGNVTVPISTLTSTTATYHPNKIDEPEHQNILVLYGGVAIPASKNDLSLLSAGEQYPGKTGWSIGGQILHEIDPHADIGLDVGFTQLQKRTIHVVGRFTSADTQMSVRSVVVLGVIRLHPARTKSFIPFFLAGLGAHSSRLLWTAQPGSPFAAGYSSELINDTKSSVAIAMGGGCEAKIHKKGFIGLEARWTYLGKTTHNATPALQFNQVGGIEGSQLNFNFLLHSGIRF